MKLFKTCYFFQIFLLTIQKTSLVSLLSYSLIDNNWIGSLGLLHLLNIYRVSMPFSGLAISLFIYFSYVSYALICT